MVRQVYWFICGCRNSVFEAITKTEDHKVKTHSDCHRLTPETLPAVIKTFQLLLN